MTALQENKLSMYHAVVSFSLDTPWLALIASVPALQNGFASLGHLLTPLDASSTGQTTSTQQSTGATQDKKTRKDNLINAILAVAGPLYALGAALGNNEIVAVANTTASKLKVMRDDLLGSRATSIHTLATANAAALVPNGVGPGQLSALLNQRNTWNANTQRPRQLKASATGHGVNLSAQLKVIDALLKNQLDKLMLPFKASNPSFYSVYLANRVIHDTSGKKKTPPAPPPPTP